MCTLNSDLYGDCGEKVAETLYNMGSICFARGELRKAIRLLRKVSEERRPLVDFVTVFSWAYYKQNMREMCAYMYVY